MTDGDELGESDLPGQEALRAACVAEEDAQVWVGKVPAQSPQLLVDVIDGDSFALQPIVAFESHKLSELSLSILEREEVHNDVSFEAVSVRKPGAVDGR